MPTYMKIEVSSWNNTDQYDYHFLRRNMT